jgi:hypothetical protein
MPRRNLTFTGPNFEWLQREAPTEKALSQLVNDIVQRQRTLGPIETRMQRHAEVLDRAMVAISQLPLHRRTELTAVLTKVLQ